MKSKILTIIAVNFYLEHHIYRLSYEKNQIKKFRSLQKLLGELNRETVLLLISFDPEFDVPGVLKKYGQLFEADFSNWHFITRDKQTVEKVCDDYNIIAEAQGNETYRHSMITFLIDRNNNVRKMYFANTWKSENVKEDIITLLGENHE